MNILFIREHNEVLSFLPFADAAIGLHSLLRSTLRPSNGAAVEERISRGLPIAEIEYVEYVVNDMPTKEIHIFSCSLYAPASRKTLSRLTSQTNGSILSRSYHCINYGRESQADHTSERGFTTAHDGEPRLQAFLVNLDDDVHRQSDTV